MSPFIPSWLDDAGLTAAEMRVFVHLCRSADNSSGIAWPSYARMVEITGLSRATIARTVCVLERRKMIEKIGKPFGGSCRYRILSIVSSESTLGGPIVSPEEQLEDPNSLTREHIENPPIVSPENCNMLSGETSIVSLESKEGNPKKGIQRRVSNKEEDVALPFDSESFCIAWDEWKQHRREKRKPVTPLSAKKTLRDLAKMGEERAISAINHSIANGYQGIFEPSQAFQSGNSSNKLPKMSLDEARKMLGGRGKNLTEYPEPNLKPRMLT